ncbi:hypothetical protein ACWPXT_12730, partial [Enterococcus faecium]
SANAGSVFSGWVRCFRDGHRFVTSFFTPFSSIVSLRKKESITTLSCATAMLQNISSKHHLSRRNQSAGAS